MTFCCAGQLFVVQVASGVQSPQRVTLCFILKDDPPRLKKQLL